MKISDVREQIIEYENMKHIADQLGYVEINGELTVETTKGLCFDYGQAGIGRKWFPKSKVVTFFLGVHRGYVYFAPSWCFKGVRCGQ